MRNNDFIKGFKAGAVILPRRIVKFGANDVTAIQAAAAADASIGVSDLGAAAIGDHVSVVMGQVAIVEYGGNVTRGAQLTSDADGKAVTAAPSAGANVRIIGTAMVSGVSGDLGSVFIAPSMLQGA
jgi:hypothetical protein